MDERMSDSNKPKVYRIVLTEVLGLAEAVAPSTIQSAIRATGSFGQYNQYYEEASRILEKASTAGTISPNDVSSIRATLDKWRGLSEEYKIKIVELTKENEPEKLVDIKKEIDEQVPGQQEMIQAMHEKMLGTKIWSNVTGFFAAKISDKEKTAFFEDTPHAKIVDWLFKWIETKNNENFFGEIIHGTRESGVDIIVQVSSGSKQKFGIQVKNNEDVKAKDFSQKLKAQITDSKKHKVQGLILFFAANMTDGSVEKKISNILSEISQIDDTFIKPISPERAITIISEVIS
jgi:hypothetical protein